MAAQKSYSNQKNPNVIGRKGKNMFDIAAIGETVLDFSPAGLGEMNNPCFEMNPGGAPANVLVASASLGSKTAFLGKQGDDLFGKHLISALKRRGVETSGVCLTREAGSLMSFVSLDELGEREFFFVRGTGTDFLMTKEEVDYSIIEDSSVLHVSPAIGRKQPGREMLFHVLEYAAKKEKTISVDPNYREMFWKDKQEAIQVTKKVLEYANVVKASGEEMEMLTGRGINKVAEGARDLFEFGATKRAVFITMGALGSYYVTQQESGFVKGFEVDAVDTTGCGDAFMGAILYYFTHDRGRSTYEIVKRANAMGALCATKSGAFDAMPTKEELYEFLSIR